MNGTTDAHAAPNDARLSIAGLLAPLLLLAAVSVAIMPRSHWELDEFLFRAGIESFEPLAHHPHPPGYPALIGLGKVATAITGDPFAGMRALAVVSTLVGFAALAAAAASMTGSRVTGVTAAAFFYFSCAQLVHSTTPMSDPPALMFLFVGLWAFGRMSGEEGRIRYAAIMGAGFAMSIGCRPQYAVALVPGLLVAVHPRFSRGRAEERRRPGGWTAGVTPAHGRSRPWRLAAVALGSFTIACLTWMVPLVVATGGVEGFLEYELGQAAYVAAHDAELSRGWMTTKQVLLRFVAHPWGGREISGVVLLLALAGLVVAARRRMMRLAPVLVIGAAHLAFTVVTSDPADGVRYALVAQASVAVLAAVALGSLDRLVSRPWPSLAAAVVLALVSFAYVWPVVSPRMNGASPPVRAAEWIKRSVPNDAILLVDNSLRPHAAGLLPGRLAIPVEDGLRQYWNEPSHEVWILANGRTATPGAMVFEWDAWDHPTGEADRVADVERDWMNAFGKLTRNHYGVVSVIPFPPERRYLPGDGVFPWERSPRRAEWRWLAPEARLRIPPGDGALTLTLHLPKEAPDATLPVEISSPEGTIERTTIARSDQRDLVFPFPEAGGDLVIRSASSYVPREIGARDPRTLSIQLLALGRVPERDARPDSDRPVMMDPPKE